MLVGLIATFGLTVFIASCKDHSNDSSSCLCSNGEMSRTIDPSSYGASNCSDLELKLETAAAQTSGEDMEYSCK